MLKIQKRFRSIFALALVLVSLSQASVGVFAASSSSYQLDGEIDSLTNSTSSSYQSCLGITDIVSQGTSSSYSLTPLLDCELSPTPPVCGNAVIETGETCDDGNVTNGDGCSSVCLIEVPSGGGGGGGGDGGGGGGGYYYSPPDTPIPAPPAPPDGPPPTSPIPPLLPAADEPTPTPPPEPAPSPAAEPVPVLPTYGVAQLPPAVTPTDDISDEVVVFIPQPMTGEECLIEDLSRLYFNELPGGSGDYDIQVRDSRGEYPLMAIPTDPGFFSFFMETQLPNGDYQITLRDKLNPEQDYETELQVQDGQVLQLPLILNINEERVFQEQCLQYFISFLDQPVITGETPSAALIAIYSELLGRTYIVASDLLNDFSFLYPEKMTERVNDLLTIVAIYPDGHRSQEQHLEIEFILQAAPSSPIFSETAPAFFTTMKMGLIAVVTVLTSFIVAALLIPAIKLIFASSSVSGALTSRVRLKKK